MARRLGLLMTVAALALAPCASAANRYASASGAGTACSQAAPCTLKQSIVGAADGDDIFVPANLGDYSESSSITQGVSPHLVHIHGVQGRPRIVFTNGGGLAVSAAQSTVE